MCGGCVYLYCATVHCKLSNSGEGGGEQSHMWPLPCVMDDFAKNANTLFSMASPLLAYMTFTSWTLQIYCLYVLIKAIKHHSTKNLLNYKVLPRTFRTFKFFFKFYCLNYLSYRALKMQGHILYAFGPKHAMRERVKGCS